MYIKSLDNDFDTSSDTSAEDLKGTSGYIGKEVIKIMDQRFRLRNNYALNFQGECCEFEPRPPVH